MLKYLSLAALVMLVSCAPKVHTARTGGLFPPREANCALELRNGTLTMELTSTYDSVGVVTVDGEEGEVPNSPRILSLVKPEACALGGEVVIVVASANLTNNIQTASSHTFMVLRKKAPGAPASQNF